MAGLGLIITGGVIQGKYKSYFDFFGNSFGSVAILLIIIGAVIFVIGFFGCCGAYKENYCMVMTVSKTGFGSRKTCWIPFPISHC